MERAPICWAINQPSINLEGLKLFKVCSLIKIEFEINNLKKSEEFINMWKLNNTNWVKEKITEHFEMNENEDTTC